MQSRLPCLNSRRRIAALAAALSTLMVRLSVCVSFPIHPGQAYEHEGCVRLKTGLLQWGSLFAAHIRGAVDIAPSAADVMEGVQTVLPHVFPACSSVPVTA